MPPDSAGDAGTNDTGHKRKRKDRLSFYKNKREQLVGMRPYLGRILLRWCDQCHTPVLAKTCAACGAPTREVPLTPPGDARPGFPADIALINSIFHEHFGAPLVPEDHLVLLNKVPDADRMEEIVIGGGIAGSIRYIPEERRWEPIRAPRPVPSSGRKSVLSWLTTALCRLSATRG